MRVASSRTRSEPSERIQSARNRGSALGSLPVAGSEGIAASTPEVSETVGIVTGFGPGSSAPHATSAANASVARVPKRVPG